MKTLKLVTATAFLLLFSNIYSQDHLFKFSPMIYVEQVDDYKIANRQVDDARFCQFGAGLSLSHRVAAVPYAGSRAELTIDSRQDMTISFSAFVLRFDVFNKLMTVEAIAPTFVFKFNRQQFFARPFGLGLDIGRNDFKIYITELISKDFSFETRLALKYTF